MNQKFDRQYKFTVGVLLNQVYTVKEFGSKMYVNVDVTEVLRTQGRYTFFPVGFGTS